MQQSTHSDSRHDVAGRERAREQEQHYLKQELDLLMSEGPEIFNFVEASSLDGMWFWDLENPEHEWMSDRFWRTLGYDPAEKEHRAAEWQDIIHPDDLRVAKENVTRHLADPSFPYDQIVRYKHRLGKTVWIRCRGLAIRDQDGRPIRFLGAHNDLTGLMEARDSLADRFEELHASNLAKADLEMFTFSASHDLNEPLRTVGGFVNKLSRRLTALAVEEDQEVRLCLDAIERAVARQRTLLSGLLEYSRLSGHEVQLSAVSLEELVNDTLDSVSASIQAAGAKVEVGPLPTITADPVLLRQVFQNLISNALKFRRETAPSIRVTSDRVGLEWVIEVTDNGIGFDQEYADRIFQLFQRLHGVGQYEGSGLGLGICKRAVEAHGGEIRALGRPGKGATFQVVLPIVGDTLLCDGGVTG